MRIMTPPTARGCLVAVTLSALALALALAACSSGAGSGSSVNGSRAATSASPAGPTASASSPVPTVGVTRSGDRKILVIAEENKTYDEVLGGNDAPYLKRLAAGYGSATAMDAGYPTSCPSLAAYLLMTSGNRYGICDDDDPSEHRISAANIFQQVAASGRQWRNYAESIPTPCSPTNGDDGLYAVRHAPAAYYLSIASRCRSWDIAMGTPANGALHQDIAAGTLPAYGFISPNVCHDMHGGPDCAGDVTSGDAWLSRWIPAIMAGSDYRRGDLAIVITWDEGSDTDNHIPTLVISPTTRHVRVAQPLTHCSILRTIEDVLRLAPLGCAADATSAASAFHLAAG
jgi:hypothetical protein